MSETIAAFAMALFGVGFFIMMMVICKLMIDSYTTTKSQKYRKLLTDMFVSGRIRQLADDYKVNLDNEYIGFLNWTKKQRNKELGLSQVIEEELKDDLQEDFKELNKPPRK